MGKYWTSLNLKGVILEVKSIEIYEGFLDGVMLKCTRVLLICLYEGSRETKSSSTVPMHSGCWCELGWSFHVTSSWKRRRDSTMSRYFRDMVGEAELEICRTFNWRMLYLMLFPSFRIAKKCWLWSYNTNLYCINYIHPKPTTVLIRPQCTSSHILVILTIVSLWEFYFEKEERFFDNVQILNEIKSPFLFLPSVQL